MERPGLLAEVFQWHLSPDSKLCWLPGMALDPHSLAFHSTAHLDILNFAGNFGFEICRFGHEWTALLNKAKYGGLVLLLGAGGVVVYFLSRKSWADGDDYGRGGNEPTNSQSSSKGFVKWLFEEELVEDLDDETNVFGRYFGPADPSLERCMSSGDADGENESDDLSLNSLSTSPSPRRFLRRPLSTQQRPEQNCRVNISNPCPRCDKGICRLKKHLASRASSTPSSCYSNSPRTLRPIKTSTPEDMAVQRTLALGRLSSLFHGVGGDLRQEGDGQESQEESSACHSEQGFRFHSRSGASRVAPDSSDGWPVSPVSRTSSDLYLGNIPREDSLDSIAEPLSTLSVCGSMLDMVTNARDIRRLIRCASLDSQDSDFSLELEMDSELGASTAEGLNQITAGIEKLIDNCDSIEGGMEAVPSGKSTMVSSKSSMSGLASLAAAPPPEQGEATLQRENSIPDMRRLQRACRDKRALWKLTNFSMSSAMSDTGSMGSLEWDSPQHGWHQVQRGSDLEETDHPSRVESLQSFAESNVGSVASLADPWEWENEWDNHSMPLGQLDGMPLPWTGQELDLEAELRQRSVSSSSSLDLVRQPPSGCSSSSASVFGESTRSRRSRASSISSTNSQAPPSKSRMSPSNSFTSEESGFMGSDALDSSFTSSMNSSSVFTSSINLSPVREGREPPTGDLLSPSSPTVWGDFKDFESTDTVIKVTDTRRPRDNPSLPRGLFKGSGAEDPKKVEFY